MLYPLSQAWKDYKISRKVTRRSRRTHKTTLLMEAVYHPKLTRTFSSLNLKLKPADLIFDGVIYDLTFALVKGVGLHKDGLILFIIITIIIIYTIIIVIIIIKTYIYIP